MILTSLLLAVLPSLVASSDKCHESCRKLVTNETSCEMIPVSCLKIDDPRETYSNCHYGANVTFPYTYDADCVEIIPQHCLTVLSRTSKCMHCFQMDEQYFTVKDNSYHTCNPKSSGPDRYITVTCEVNPEVICKAPRLFKRNVTCSFTAGKSWSTALVLSITLGGFGADRFYLGYWKEGLGKLFSFGGLGVWTIVDIALISVGYLAPADRSLYIYT